MRSLIVVLRRRPSSALDERQVRRVRELRVGVLGRDGDDDRRAGPPSRSTSDASSVPHEPIARAPRRCARSSTSRRKTCGVSARKSLAAVDGADDPPVVRAASACRRAAGRGPRRPATAAAATTAPRVRDRDRRPRAVVDRDEVVRRRRARRRAPRRPTPGGCRRRRRKRTPVVAHQSGARSASRPRAGRRRRASTPAASSRSTVQARSGRPATRDELLGQGAAEPLAAPRGGHDGVHAGRRSESRAGSRLPDAVHIGAPDRRPQTVRMSFSLCSRALRDLVDVAVVELLDLVEAAALVVLAELARPCSIFLSLSLRLAARLADRGAGVLGERRAPSSPAPCGAPR